MSDAGEVVTRCMEAMHAKDVEGVLACFHDDAEFSLPSQHFAGKDALRAMFAGFLSVATDMHMEVHRQIADGNMIVNERTDHFTIGERSVDLDICGVFQVDEGRIRYWREYFGEIPDDRPQ